MELDEQGWHCLGAKHERRTRPVGGRVRRSCLVADESGAYRVRTDDPLLAKQVLSQLS